VSGATGLFDYDRDQPLGAKVTALRPFVGDDIKAVTYIGAYHDRVPAALALPPGKTSRPCVVYVPGLGRSKADAAPLVAPLARVGIGLFAIDAPYQGARSAGPTALEHVLQNPQRLVSMFRQTVIDVRRGLDFLDTQGTCDPNRLGIIGFSFGALIGALAAGSDTRLHSTVLLSTGADWSTPLRQPGLILSPQQSRNKGVYDTYLNTLAPYNPGRWVGRIAPRPLLIVNGRHDPLTTVSSEQALHRAAGKGSVVLWYEGGHNPFFVGPQAGLVLQRVQKFLEQSLARDAQSG
jgi:dienelactone hydrolase